MRLTIDNPAQQARIAALAKLIRDKLAELARTVALRQARASTRRPSRSS